MCALFFCVPPSRGIQPPAIPATSFDKQSGFINSKVPLAYQDHTRYTTGCFWIVVLERDTNYSEMRLQHLPYFSHPSVSWYSLVLSCCLSASTVACPALENLNIVLVASSSVSGRNNHLNTAFLNLAQTILARERPPKASTLSVPLHRFPNIRSIPPSPDRQLIPIIMESKGSRIAQINNPLGGRMTSMLKFTLQNH